MTQFYIVEVKELANGEFEHVVSWAYDNDPAKARQKGESTYYTKLAAAAVSNYATHGVILFSQECYPIMNKNFVHDIQTAPEPETNGEE